MSTAPPLSVFPFIFVFISPLSFLSAAGVVVVVVEKNPGGYSLPGALFCFLSFWGGGGAGVEKNAGG